MTVTFLDVGANVGQTVAEAIRWPFDRIVAFEPHPESFAALAAAYAGTPRLELCQFGLLDRTGTFPLYGTNEALEASVWSQKIVVDPTVIHQCQFVSASEWCAANLDDADQVVMKLNCEGGETYILDNLIDSGQIWKLDDMMIDFDIRWVPGEEYRQGAIIERLRQIGYSRYALCEVVMVGNTHQDRIRHWLSTLPWLQPS